MEALLHHTHFCLLPQHIINISECLLEHDFEIVNPFGTGGKGKLPKVKHHAAVVICKIVADRIKL